jgi:hypothetical protein
MFKGFEKGDSQRHVEDKRYSTKRYSDLQSKGFCKYLESQVIGKELIQVGDPISIVWYRALTFGS